MKTEEIKQKIQDEIWRAERVIKYNADLLAKDFNLIDAKNWAHATTAFCEYRNGLKFALDLLESS
jgi:hypothetical protein